MRAREFISEQRRGKMTKRQNHGSVGMHLLQSALNTPFFDTYALNRLMMAVAQADGEGNGVDLDTESWISKDGIALPYTKEEETMLKAAYKEIGAKVKDLNNGDLRSAEPPGGNTTSPVKSFTGYPR